MSKNYTAYQYDSAYRPRALKNWEVPNIFCDRALTRTGRTKIIANTRGHILPGIRRPQCNPWGDFVGTWSMPRYISRHMAEELNRTVSGKEKLKECKARLISEELSRRVSVREKHKEIVGEKSADDEEQKVLKGESSSETHSTEADGVDEKKILCPIHDLYQE